MFFSGYMSSIHGNAFFKHRVIYTRTCYEHTHTPSRACVWVNENIEWVSERYVCSRWSFELWWRLIRVSHGSVEPCTMYLYVHTQDKKRQLITYIIYLHSCLSLRIREDCFIVCGVNPNDWLLTLHHHMFYIALCSPTYWLLIMIWCGVCWVLAMCLFMFITLPYACKQWWCDLLWNGATIVVFSIPLSLPSVLLLVSLRVLLS